MKKMIILFMAMTVSWFVLATSSHAWLIYSKPEFRGRVIDAETKEPIEGAVAVVLYYKRPLVGGPGGPNSYIFEARETLTDNNGAFYFPSYSSLIVFTNDAGANFIFFKPGYATSYGPTHVNATLREKYFSADVIGEVAEIEEGSFEKGSYVKWKGPLGIMELKKVSPEKAMPPGGLSSGYGEHQLPLLYKAINADRKNRGLKGEVK